MFLSFINIYFLIKFIYIYLNSIRQTARILQENNEEQKESIWLAKLFSKIVIIALDMAEILLNFYKTSNYLYGYA